MGSGLPAVERLVGALSTLAVGLTIYVVHRVLRPKPMTMDDYYRQKYMDTSDMIGHKGSCGCGAMTFIVLAPRNICAFDDSNTFPSKKGRIPVLIVPMTHLQMTSQSTEDANSFVSIYTHHETPTFASQHVFCKRCGIHLFHMELSRTDRVAINVHCIDDDYIQELRVVFVPKGGRPIFERLSVDAIEDQTTTSSSSTTKAIGQAHKQIGAQNKKIPPPSYVHATLPQTSDEPVAHSVERLSDSSWRGRSSRHKQTSRPWCRSRTHPPRYLYTFLVCM
ncbi:hypothetical protein SPRG_04456 [Saprolegnia parasitica CBS 223.65]|uniref:CENP-V/GFA domain-containing protein n=1 Tax=Saprolegnia parasitica (strain CBS 223.65) TaxID=695850 RepID=A0A067CMU5_SAPPC|nr:hypothetical protein SPRG_04456 [Saprolegnia parasitica CBS 223.65]KDO30555.1 hypothetical protein SPRG_04456 [Saprolegnia parasitica CBS 223.65]|eukprot:XP_012198770.1 hypothetical protein SPRG_04456 [Saprolegnia parasitica CBS 223.65]